MAAPLIASDLIASKRHLHKRTVALLIFLTLVACSLFYCFGIPVITGQACVDFVSGHVPTQAEDIFLQQVLAKWDTDYEVIGGDDLGAVREDSPARKRQDTARFILQRLAKLPGFCGNRR